MKKAAVALGILSAALYLVLQPAARAASADKFSSPDNISCPERTFSFDKTKGECVPNIAEINKIAVGDCAGPGLEAKGNACVASSTKPTPACKEVGGGYTAKLSGTGANMTCTYERTLTSSSPGDYIGDCLRTNVVPPGSNLVEGQRYLVTAQKATENDDRELTLVRGEITPWLSCGSSRNNGKGETYKVLASQMNAVGATRFGYAYGFLTMPYKYFPSEKSFQVNVPIGAYMGWRWGAAGSGQTLAAAVTLSTVKANTVDPNTLDASGKPTVTGTTDVAALSIAAGIMFDVLKSPAGKPFKTGVFVGRDIVNQDPTIDYKFNRKNWIAVQIGYSFTDN